MTQIPDSVRKAWEDRNGPVVFATVNAQGVPNVIYVTCVSIYGENMFVVADNYFSKTKANILAGSRGSLLFITSEGKSYQVKGDIKYFTEGPVYDEMKKWNPATHPGHAAAAIVPEEIYSGSEKIL
jgi:predicted pyridoxine 5'-phosphate oxidase superfamily flavin-nucleotide-binding protein